MTKSICSFLGILIVFLCGCQPGQFNKEKETKALLALLQQERKAHFERDVDLFMSEFADSMISVNKGRVTVATKGENQKRIGNYFKNVKFIRWDDVQPPVLRFSGDGSLAYAVVQKQVILSGTDISDQSFIDTTDYAWVSLYRKHKGEWKVECNVSTNN